MVPHAAQGGLRPMKIVVFGPDNRTGAVCADTIVDLCRACAKYLHEREGEPHPREMAEVLVPADLARLIAGGSRALDYAQKALAYLSAQAQDQIGLDGHPLVHPAAATSPTTQRRWPRGSGAGRTRATLTRRSAKPAPGASGSLRARSSVPTASSSIPGAASASITRARSRSCSAGAAPI